MVHFFKNDIFTCQGNPIKKIYSPVVDENGVIDLVESGEENTDEFIQSQRESCDIQTIIARFTAGDASVLEMNKGVYGDFTEMPQTYAEMLQLQIDSKKMYDSLPVEVKQLFDNDQNQFFAQSGTDEWFEKLGFVKEEKKEESEVKVEE